MQVLFKSSARAYLANQRNHDHRSDPLVLVRPLPNALVRPLVILDPDVFVVIPCVSISSSRSVTKGFGRGGGYFRKVMTLPTNHKLAATISALEPK